VKPARGRDARGAAADNGDINVAAGHADRPRDVAAC
jgi:hypothetical protein